MRVVPIGYIEAEANETSEERHSNTIIQVQQNV